jgi:hypothetical protein
MADRFRRMPVSPEMNAFKAEVRRDQHFLFGPQSQHRTVVSYAGYHGTIRAHLASPERHLPDTRNESFFGKRHSEEIIAPNRSLRIAAGNWPCTISVWRTTVTRLLTKFVTTP